MPRTDRFTATTIDCEDAAPELAPGLMLIMTKAGRPYRAEFLCPCGCGQYVCIFIDPDRHYTEGDRRMWKYTPGPTLEPSVRWTGGCLAHFNVVAGVVSWE